MKRMLIAVTCIIAMSGCASVQNAGNASYSIEPVSVGGATVCCRVSISDGKERAALDLHVIKNGDSYDVTLSERDVAAFQGQGIAAGAVGATASAAAKVGTAAALAPLVPMLAPALAAPGIGAAAVGAAGAVAAEKAMGK